MNTKNRMTGDNFHKRIGTGKKSILSTSSIFNNQENKNESFPILIQVLKSDLIQIHDMIRQNSSEIKMYKLLSKTPGLTKKLSEIEESKTINNLLEKILEESKNIDNISKIYNCKGNELNSKNFFGIKL